jgi:DNA-binding SARP family transcriptional activator
VLKRVIQADPLLEEAYQKLMTFYSTRGVYSEALKVYQSCKKTLKKELKTKPDATTDAIYNKIFEKTGTSRTAKRKTSVGKK